MKCVKKIIVVLLTVVVFSLSLFTGCGEAISINRLIRTLENINPVAVLSNAKVGLQTSVEGQTQSVELKIKSVENVNSQACDLTVEVTALQGEEEQTAVQDVYVREGKVYATEEYLKGDEETAKILRKEYDLQTALNDILSQIQVNVNDVTIQDEQSALFVKFAKEYDAIEVDGETFTLNFNKLLYNVTKQVCTVLENINSDTTVLDVLKNRTIKNLINNIAGGDSALDIYNDVYASTTSNPLSEYKPQKGQSLYDYVLEICNSKEFVKDTVLGTFFGPDKTIAEYNVYEVINALTGREGEDFVEDICEALKNVKENECVIAIPALEGVTVNLVLKELKMQITLDRGNLNGVSVTGEIALKTVQAEQSQTISLNINLSVTYFKEEQNLADLNEFSFLVQKAYFYDRTFTTTPLRIYPNSEMFEAVIDPENGSVKEFYFFNANKKITPEYDAEEEVYRYIQNGNGMYVKISANKIDVYFDGTDELFATGYIINPGVYTKEELITYEQYIKNEGMVF